MLNYNTKLKHFSRLLRTNMTGEEIILWSKLRMKQIGEAQFYRQRTIGNYIVDFYCPKAKLIIELDGGQHYTEEGKEKDIVRDEYFKNLGLKILRFQNKEVRRNLRNVIEEIYNHVVNVSEN
ncbi:MAG: hypothetical protein A2X61_06235 [Ignavibacteria bacterium GWB2_35_12]|nr:MAG: hypothetical protein A2X63_08060 [Ignavibacteria bacterium GWA2_35_8]OGU37774.1 MAG: hypothetical protein A2X61_06235 [Ignavibacteria bacterium GWB2_35_12]OGU93174.1 MAG: hypothetical protein A2220_11215 [Ignavibacteria bacterium RIFOXYA2_FULL_35_10]OGV19983.1 MAG: hypothetical protein A2475_00215 [Ignavibacteria bacterium RIFOXYC2_FULL_35_21]